MIFKIKNVKAKYFEMCGERSWNVWEINSSVDRKTIRNEQTCGMNAQRTEWTKLPIDDLEPD